MAVAAFASMALVGETEGRFYSTWAKKRVAATKYRLERHYGKGLTGLHNEHGQVDPDRLGWINKRTNGAPIGSSISVTIMPGLTLDASTGSAYLLGFVQGLQYNGLGKDGDAILPNEAVELTNCFAATFALLEDFETSAYNLKTFASESGTLKFFDTLILDPSHILADLTVEYEMCEVASIFAQYKGMIGGDYAAVSDNLSREILVIAVESPEARKTIQDVYASSKCIADAAKESGLLDA